MVLQQKVIFQNSQQNIGVGENVSFGFNVSEGISSNVIRNIKLAEYKSGIVIHDTDEGIGFNSNKKEVSNSGDCIIFYAKTTSSYNQLFVIDVEKNEIVAELKDSGNFAKNGDDIQGNGVWSAKYYVNSNDLSNEEKTYAVVENSEVTIKSNTVRIKIMPSITKDDLDNMNYVSKKIKEIFSLYKTEPEDMPHEFVQNSNSVMKAQDNSELKNKFDELLEELKSEGRIRSYSYDEINGTYSFHYKNDINSFISLADWFTGDNSTVEFKPNMDKNYDGYRAVILNAFENTDYRTEFYEELIEDWRDNGMDVDYDDDVTVDDMKTKMAYKDIISLSGHGCRVDDESLFCLSDDIATTDKNSEYMDDILSNRVHILHSTEDIYCVSSDFFEFYYGAGQLKGSFIFSEACQFMGHRKKEQTFWICLLQN